jgi:hypothetical protein
VQLFFLTNRNMDMEPGSFAHEEPDPSSGRPATTTRRPKRQESASTTTSKSKKPPAGGKEGRGAGGNTNKKVSSVDPSETVDDSGIATDSIPEIATGGSTKAKAKPVRGPGKAVGGAGSSDKRAASKSPVVEESPCDPERKPTKSTKKSSKRGAPKSAMSSNVACSLNADAVEFVPQRSYSAGDYCLICANPLHYCAVGMCEHDICSVCALRIRIKNKDKACAICKQELPFMVVYQMSATGQRQQFTSFNINEDAPAPGVDVEHQSSMYFVNCHEHFRKMSDMRSIICPVTSCGGRFSAESHLLHHLKTAHQLHLCLLCLENRPLFISEQQLYTKSQLSQHLNAPPGTLTGAGGDKTAGHPMCHFCGERFFDSPALYKVWVAKNILSCKYCC